MGNIIMGSRIRLSIAATLLAIKGVRVSSLPRKIPSATTTTTKIENQNNAKEVSSFGVHRSPPAPKTKV